MQIKAININNIQEVSMQASGESGMHGVILCAVRTADNIYFDCIGINGSKLSRYSQSAGITPQLNTTTYKLTLKFQNKWTHGILLLGGAIVSANVIT